MASTENLNNKIKRSKLQIFNPIIKLLFDKTNKSDVDFITIY